MERKVSEIKSSKEHRASFHNNRDLYGGGRPRRGDSSDMNHNPFAMLGHSADGSVRYEDGKEGSSSEGLDSSQENLSQSYWSDEENYSLRRRR